MKQHHDRNYKEIFSYPEVVQQLMQEFVPSEISSLLDYSTLENESGNYLTPKLEEKVEDVVWSIQFLDKSPEPIKLYLYILLEFQSKPDPAMPLRMLLYTASFYHQLIKQKKIKLSKKKLPPVIPLVLYNGARNWKVPQDMQSLIQPVPEFLRKLQPQLNYLLIDEQSYSFAELEEKPSPLSSLFALEKARSSEQMARSLVSLLKRSFNHPNAERMYPIFKRWAQVHLNYNKIDINLEQISDLEEINMFKTKLDYLKEEGRQEGRQEGVKVGMKKGWLEGSKKASEDIALNFLRAAIVPIEQAAEILGMSIDKLKALQEKHGLNT